MPSSFDFEPGGSIDLLRTQLLLAAVDFSKLNEFVENLLVTTNSDAALFRYLDFKDFSYPVTMTAGDPEIFSETFFAEYDGGMVQSDPQIKFGLDFKIPKYSVYLCNEQYSEEARKNDPYFSEFLPRYNIKWFAGYLANVKNTFGAGFGIARSADKPHYTDREKNILATLTPILEDWAQVFILVQQSKMVQTATSKAYADKASFAACIDAQKRVLWQDENSEQFFKDLGLSSLRKPDEGALTLYKNELKASSKSEGERFLNAASEVAKKPKIGSPTSLKPPSEITVTLNDDQKVSVRFDPIFAEENNLEEAALKACLITGAPVSNAAQMISPLASGIDLTKKLSKKELEVARLVSMGLKAPKIAENLGVEPSTIHTHLKRAYKKLDINSQSELTALYIQSGLPLGKGDKKEFESKE